MKEAFAYLSMITFAVGVIATVFDVWRASRRG